MSAFCYWGLGYVPDRHKRPGEKQDWDFKEHVAAAQQRGAGFKAAHVSVAAGAGWREAGFVTILNQGQRGTCVTFGIGGSWLAQQRYEQLPDPEQPSELAIYRARALEGTLAEDSGLQIRDGYDYVRRVGVMRARHWPYTDSADPVQYLGKTYERWNLPVPPELDRFAIPQSQAHSDLQYARVYDTGDARLEQLAQADEAGVPIVFGCSVSEQFCQCNFDATKPYDPTTQGGASQGLHCEWIVPGGMRREPDGTTSFLVANSWGTTVLDAGFWRMSEACAANGLMDVHAQLRVPAWAD